MTPVGGVLFKLLGCAIERACEDGLTAARGVKIDRIGSGHGSWVPVSVIHAGKLPGPGSARGVHVIVLTCHRDVVSRERSRGRDRGRGEVDPVGGGFRGRVKEERPVREIHGRVEDDHIVGLPADSHVLEVGGQGQVAFILPLLKRAIHQGVTAAPCDIDSSGSAGIGGGPQGRDLRGHVKRRPIDERAHLQRVGVGVRVDPVPGCHVVREIGRAPFNERRTCRIGPAAFRDENPFRRWPVRDRVLGGSVVIPEQDHVPVRVHIERGSVLPSDIDREAVAVEGGRHVSHVRQARRVDIHRHGPEGRGGRVQGSQGRERQFPDAGRAGDRLIERLGGSHGLRGGWLHGGRWRHGVHDDPAPAAAASASARRQEKTGG